MAKSGLKLRRAHKMLTLAGATLITAGIGWVAYEIRKTQNVINNSFDPKVLDQLDTSTTSTVPHTTYIYNNSQKPSLWSVIRSSFATTYSYRLLEMTKNENLDFRLRSIRSLAKMDYLSDWDYRHIAQMCNASTAVGLARSENVDMRFFLPPPYRPISPNYEKLIKCVKTFIRKLNEHSAHPCLVYFIDKTFQDKSQIVDNDSTSLEVSKEFVPTNDVLFMCLKSVLHHSAIRDNARDIVMLNGLPLLMEIHQRYKDNPEVSIILAKIISNISVYPEFLKSLFGSGWIGVLAKWVKSPDIRISAPAARALANLDSDEHIDSKYPSKVYLLHPMYRKKQNIDVDVVLVHGLLGGVFYTWRKRDQSVGSIGLLGKKGHQPNENDSLASDDEQIIDIKKLSDPQTREYLEVLKDAKESDLETFGKDFEMVMYDCPENANGDDGEYSYPEDLTKYRQEMEDGLNGTQCWPKDWLPKDCQNLRIIGLNYDTNISMWVPVCPEQNIKMTLNERSDDFTEKLLLAGIGKRPIIWITHSMGGLLVKNILVNAWKNKNTAAESLCKNTKGIIFYSTPHQGSQLASLKQATAFLVWPSIEVQELRHNSPELLKLHEEFLNMLKEVTIKIISFAETKSTMVSAMKFQFMFVHGESADPGVGEFYQVPIDHLSICKPANRLSFLYQRIIKLIESVSENKTSN